MMGWDEKTWRMIAGINGFLAIAMGAVAAHAIADPQLSAIAEKASLYQLIHAVALLWLAGRQGKGFQLVRRFIASGLLLFCGSLYLKALTGWAAATTLAPMGGMSFMAAWLLLALVPREGK